MSALSDVFNSIKTHIETDWADLEAIFKTPKGAGFTQANFAKLIADFENGVLADTQQFLVLVHAVGVWGQSVTPIAQQIVNDAALVAAVQPAVAPIVAGMQASLLAAEALDQILIGQDTTASNLAQAINTLTSLERQTASWFTDAVAAIKAATAPKAK